MDSLPETPIPISLVHGKFLLFSIQAVSYIRREHHICGSLIGTIPQSPSQNVFLGLPVELMPEEAQILVEKGVAYILNDVEAHNKITKEIDLERRTRYLSSAECVGEKVAKIQLQKKVTSRQRSLKALSSGSGSATPIGQAESEVPLVDNPGSKGEQPSNEISDGSLFPQRATSSNTALKPLDPLGYAVTPATSEHLLPTPPKTPPTIHVPSSYPLFKHLHGKGFYLCPGLRFGCQYTVYPGDPLRFHSHFLAVGTDWDGEIDLMDIVGGGRLGTGVKKGYLFGGANSQGEVKTFTVEWAGM